MRFAVLFVLLFALSASSGCSCHKSDEEILKERIDTTSVHLYAATKIAVLKSDEAPTTKAAYDKLGATMGSIAGKQRDASGPAPVSTQDFLDLAKALWELRAEGQELVRSGNEKNMAPILPKLVGNNNQLAEVLDLNTEHGLLVLAMFSLKFHPASPVPLPDEILLYESWMTDSPKLKLPGMGPVVASAKAIIYGMNTLCDLAKKEADYVEKEREAIQSGAFAETAKKLFGNNVDLDNQSLTQAANAARALAHGGVGICFIKRDQKEKGLDELEKSVAALHELGVPPADTALIRAYVAYEKKDYDKAEAAIKEARENPNADEDTKKACDELQGYVNAKKDDKLEAAFSQPFMVAIIAKGLFRRLDQSKAFDAIKNSQVSTTLRSYFVAIQGVVDAMPSIDGATTSVKKAAGCN